MNATEEREYLSYEMNRCLTEIQDSLKRVDSISEEISGLKCLKKDLEDRVLELELKIYYLKNKEEKE